MKNYPEALKHFDQWDCWRSIVSGGRAGAQYHVQQPRTGVKASPIHPSTWASFEEAQRGREIHKFEGLSYVIDCDDPFIAIKLSGAVDVEGVPTAAASEIMKIFDSYSERTPDGRGLLIIISAEIDKERIQQGCDYRRRLVKHGRIEKSGISIIAHSAFLLLTGDRIESAPADVKERSDALDKLIDRHFLGLEEPSSPAEGVSAVNTVTE